jgi:EH domain-containing protein 3/EH domain-containing protein 1
MSLNFKKKSIGKDRLHSSSPSGSQTFEDDEYAKVIEGIKKIYKQKIKPVEVTYNFEGIVTNLSW